MANGSETAGQQNGPGSASATTRVASAAHEAIDAAASKAEPVEKDVRARAADAAAKAEEAHEAATAKVDESIDSLLKFMRHRPVTAVGIAFAAGIVASSILRR